MLATQHEQWATKVYVLLNIHIMLVPTSIIFHYSFNTIQFRTFASWDTFSVISVAYWIIVFWCKILKKHTLGFAIAVYFAFLLMIGNILMDIEQTMERTFIISLNYRICNCICLVNFKSRKIPGTLMTV